MTTLIADRFAPETRGGVSGIVGAGMTAGLTAGTVVAGYLAGERVLAYGLFAGAIAASCLAFVAINREPASDAMPRRPMRWGEFLKGFWISPREHPDFAWAFASRFFIYMGYQAVAAYLLYLAERPPQGRAPELGGPREEDLADMVRRYAHAIGFHGPVPAVNAPGAWGHALRGGALLPGPGAVLGEQTFAEWLDALPDA